MCRYSKAAVRVRIPHCPERLFFFSLFYSGRKTKFLFCTLMPKTRCDATTRVKSVCVEGGVKRLPMAGCQATTAWSDSNNFKILLVGAILLLIGEWGGGTSAGGRPLRPNLYVRSQQLVCTITAAQKPKFHVWCCGVGPA